VGRRLLLVEDDSKLRALLGAACPDAWQATLVGNGAEALRHVRAASFDLALVDLGLPDIDGVELIRSIAGARPDLPIVVLTICTSERRILDAFRAGAQGYVFKEDLGRGLGPLLDQVIAGGAPMSRAVARLVLDQVRATPQGARIEPRAILTDREQQVVEQLAHGLSYDEVGAVLKISQNTVRSYIRTIYEKLSVSTKTEAVLAALRMGLL
jgi:DNA-binding NarL/FixJ family response regulator